MAFPTVTGRASSYDDVSGTDHVVSLPSGIQASELLIVVFGTDGSESVTWDGTGFTEFFQLNNGTANTLALAYKWATGLEGATITVTTGTAELSGHTAYRISGAENPNTQVPEVSTGAVGSTQYPAPDTCTPTGGPKDFLWLAVQGNDHLDTITGYPSGYSNGINGVGVVNGSAGAGSAEYPNNASSESPGTFTLSAAEQWVAATIAIHPTSGTGPTHQRSIAGAQPAPSGVLTAGTYIVKQGIWRWYTDATPDASMVAKAGEGSAPVLTTADMQSGIVRLRVQLNETGGRNDSSAIQLQYSEDGTNWLDIDDNPAAESGPYFRWGAGAATHGNTVGQQLLTGTTASGKYHEDADLSETLPANSKLEIDIALENCWPPPDVTWRFRLVANGTPIDLDGGSSQIQLTSSTAANRGYAITYIAPDADNVPPRDVRYSFNPKIFFDGTRWWLFVVQFDDPTKVAYYYWDGPSNEWSVASTVTFTGNHYKNAIGMVLKVISGTPVVWIAAVDGDTSTSTIYYRRGTVSGTTISWASEANITQGHSRCVAIDIDDGNYIWIVSYSSNYIRATRSTNADVGSSWSSGWESSLALSESTPATRASLTAIALASDKCMAIWENAAGIDLRWAIATNAGGWGSAADVNTTTNANDQDWGVTRSGGYVYLVHTDSTGEGGNWVLRVFNESGGSWSTGTDPSLSGLTGANDGILCVANGDDVYAFSTESVGALGGRVLKYKKYTGPGDSGSWGAWTLISPAADRGNGDYVFGPRSAGGGTLVAAWLFNDDGLLLSGSTIEYHYLSTGILRSVAGVQPAASGTLSQNLSAYRSPTGTQPAASGSLTRSAGTFMRVVAGDQPAPSGALARTYQTARSSAGNQPYATGTLSAVKQGGDEYLRSVAGDQPASAGALTRKLQAKRTLTGVQPAPAGTLTRVGTLARSATGSQPNATGTLARTLQALRSASGNQLAASGTLTRIEQALRASDGVQPAATGTVEAVKLGGIERSVAGNQPTATGTLTAKRWLFSSNYAEDFETTLVALARSVAGEQPAPSGTLVRTEQALRAAQGEQPAPSGALTRFVQALRSLIGSQPTATGALTRIEQAQRSLASSQPSATGTLSTQLVTVRSVLGSQPASTGTLARIEQALRTLAGAQLSASGTLSRFAQIGRSLAGNQPSATGVLTATKGLNRNVAGVQPSASGTLTRIEQAQRSLAGGQPSATGTLIATKLVLTRSVAGTQPAPTGALTRIEHASRTLAGVLPAPTGTLVRQASLSRSVAGIQPAPSGVLTATPFVGVLLAELDLYLTTPSLVLRLTTPDVDVSMHDAAASAGLTTANVTAHQKSATLILNTEGGN